MKASELWIGFERIIEDIVFTIVSVPKTLARIVSSPTWIAGYVETQLAKGVEGFQEYASPLRLYLLAAIVLAASAQGTASLFGMRGAPNAGSMFSIFQDEGVIFVLAAAVLVAPLYWSLAVMIYGRIPFRREYLIRELYVQCYYFLPGTLAASVLNVVLLYAPGGNFKWRWEEAVLFLALLLLMAAFGAWLIIVETRHLAGIARCSSRRAFLVQLIIYVTGLALSTNLSLFFLTFRNVELIDMFPPGIEEGFLSIPVPATGQYVVIVSSVDGTSGECELAVTRTMSSGNVLPPVTSTHNLPPHEDAGEESEFSWREGDHVDVVVKPLTSTLDVGMDVRDATGRSLLGSDFIDLVNVLAGMLVLVLLWPLVRGGRAGLRWLGGRLRGEKMPVLPPYQNGVSDQGTDGMDMTVAVDSGDPVMLTSLGPDEDVTIGPERGVGLGAAGSPMETMVQKPASASAAWLVGLDGEVKNRRLRLSADSSGETRLGRASSNTHVLNGDGTVSQHHAMVQYRDGTFVIRDLGAANQTMVNGRAITRQTLRDGDEVSIGNLPFVFKDPGGDTVAGGDGVTRG